MSTVYNKKVKKINNSILITLGIIADSNLLKWRDQIYNATKILAEQYEYYEILIITSASIRERVDVLSFLRDYSYVRILCVSKSEDYDSIASYLQSESIGDYVVTVPSDELEYINLTEILENLDSGYSLVRIRRNKATVFQLFCANILKFITGLEIDARYMRTLAVSRSLLIETFNDKEPDSYFRFSRPIENKNGEGAKLKNKVINLSAPQTRIGLRSLLDKVYLAYELITISSTRFLKILSLFFFILAFFCILWIAYVLLIAIFKKNVAEGWSSISLFLGWIFLIQTLFFTFLSIGLVRLLTMKKKKLNVHIMDDISKNDMFRNFSFLNVETDLKKNDKKK